MRFTAIASAVSLLLVISACGGGDGEAEPASGRPSSTPSVKTIEARLAVAMPNALAIADTALGKQPDADSCDAFANRGIEEGAQAALLDSTGETVATANLKAVENINAAGKICSWSATFDAVPAGGKFYSARVGEYVSPQMAERDLGNRALVITD